MDFSGLIALISYRNKVKKMMRKIVEAAA